MVNLSKEDGGDGDSGDDAAEVGKQTCHNGVTGLANAYGTEIDGQNVEGGVGGSLEDTGPSITAAIAAYVKKVNGID